MKWEVQCDRSCLTGGGGGGGGHAHVNYSFCVSPEVKSRDKTELPWVCLSHFAMVQ